MEAQGDLGTRYTASSPAQARRTTASMFKAVLVVLQTVLFLVLFLVGSFLPAFHVLPAWQVSAGAHRVFLLDGLLLTLVVYLLILGMELARRRLRGPGGLTTLALVLALALGFAMKFGFKSV